MSPWLLAAGLLAVGCGFAPATVLPTVDSGSADAPGSNVDTDGDGVVDSADNCPTVPNLDQNDKDGDGIGDACDPCPHLGSGGSADRDGDGIGDACDPRPDTAGDSLVVFDGFYIANDIAAWMPLPSNNPWQVRPDHTADQNDASGGDRVLQYSPQQLTQVYVAVTIELGTINSNGGAGMCSGVATGQQYCCELKRNGGSSTASLNATEIGNQTSVMWNGTFQVSDTLMLTSTVTNTNLHCDATVGSNEQQIDLPLTSAPNPGVFELYTGSVSAAFTYAFVVAIGT